MSGKAIIGAVAVLAAIGVYGVIQKSQAPIEAEPEEVALVEEEPSAIEYYPEPDPYNVEDGCPDMEGAVTLNFDDEHSEATLATVKAYQEEVHVAEYLEEGDNIRLISYVDLNNDGRDDFITLYNGMNWCGSAGCLIEVFIQNEDGSYSGSPLTYGSKGDIRVTNGLFNDYRQLIISGKPDSRPGDKQLWNWIGDKYSRYGNCRDAS